MKKTFLITFFSIGVFLLPNVSLAADKFPVASGETKVCTLAFEDPNGVTHTNEKVTAYDEPGQDPYFQDSQGNKYIVENYSGGLTPVLVSKNLDLSLAAQGYIDQNGALTDAGKKAQDDGYIINNPNTGITTLTTDKGEPAAEAYNDQMAFSNPVPYFQDSVPPPANPAPAAPAAPAINSGGSGVPPTSAISGGSGVPGSGISNPLGQTTTLYDFFTKILGVVVYLGGIVITLALIYCGFLFVKAQGNSEELETAKRAFLWTVIGAGVLLGAQIFSSIIQSTISQL